MNTLNKGIFTKKHHPIKAMQFGEGNFLRAFVDYMLDIGNEQEVTDIGVAVIKAIPMGTLEAFDTQDNLYTVCLRGMQEGQVIDSSRIVSSIEEVVDCYTDYSRVEEIALLDEMDFVFSNTTEAGIVFEEKDRLEDTPPNTFPAKLTKLLYKRFEKFNGAADKGLVVIPCELIERNGDNLKKCVQQYSRLWSLGEGFDTWLENANIFCNTLVDRIVTGYPTADAENIFEKLGYRDTLLSAAEPFGFWVIESDKDISKKLPLDKAGLEVLFTKDQTPYRERKVRILNGGHTTMVPIAFLAGEDIVRDCMNNPIIRKYLETTLSSEIIPTLTLPKKELEDFSVSVIERFENPFIDHALLSITLNSVSKWKARVLPSFKDYVKNTGDIPTLLAFSLAGLIAFYKGDRIEDGALIGTRNGKEYKVIDDTAVLGFFLENCKEKTDILVKKVLANTGFWGEDLTEYHGIVEKVVDYLDEINSQGAISAIKEVLEEKEVSQGA